MILIFCVGKKERSNRPRLSSSLSTNLKMLRLPRCASVNTDDIDVQAFFSKLADLNVNDNACLQDFLEKFRGVKFRIAGISESIVVTGNDSTNSADFEQFSIDLWKEYYIQEDVYQIGILEDKSPIEVNKRLLPSK